MAEEIKNTGNILNISKICQKAILKEIENLRNEKKERRLLINEIKSVILERKSLLVGLAKNKGGKSGYLDETDRDHIISYLERDEIPERPQSAEYLLKVYASSSLSFPIVRRQLTPLIGKIPTPETIPHCLGEVFGAEEFQNDCYWTPSKMVDLTTKIKKRECFTDTDLSSLKTNPRILAILLDGANLLNKNLKIGLGEFYREVSEAIKKGPDETWRFVKKTSGSIRHVGPALICDFLKNIGFSEFVRVGGYFQREFPVLINEKMMSEKRQFIMSLELCNELGIKPFHFDHIMYQWGRNKRFLMNNGEEV